MKKIIIPEELTGKSLYKFLIDNKKALIDQKKSVMHYGQPINAAVKFIVGDMPETAVKAGMNSTTELEDTGVISVKVVANTSMWCDSYMDVLCRDSAAKSIKERKGMIPFVHDHVWQMDAQIADVNNIYYQEVSLKDLGLKKEGTAQGLIFEADVLKVYNEKIYNLYRRKKVKQHSIGLNYTRIELAINDEDYEKEIDFWNKWVDQIINKEVAEEKGYFWLVQEYKLIENSAVLFGANILTPTLEASSKSEEEGDEIKTDGSTSQQPASTTVVTPQTKGDKWDRIGDLFSKQLN